MRVPAHVPDWSTARSDDHGIVALLSQSRLLVHSKGYTKYTKYTKYQRIH